MYCPECKTEYRQGFYECADCKIPLVHELSAEKETEETEKYNNLNDQNLTLIMKTGRIHEKELLITEFSNSNIPYKLIEPTSLHGAINTKIGPGSYWAFYIPENYLEKANEILAQLTFDITTDPDIWHFDSSDESKFKWRAFSISMLVMVSAFLLFIIYQIIRRL